MSWMDAGEWLNPPVDARADGDELRVTTVRGSDFWRDTYYGFTRDTGHALLTGIAGSGSLEVDLRVDFAHLYDQAGLMLRTDAQTWLKAGVEITDGVPHVGAVVTHGESDWSLAPVPEWSGRVVTVRASWAQGAVTLRARAAGDPWRTIRLAPFRVEGSTRAGVYACSPERDRLVVTFTGARSGPPDPGLHSDPPPPTSAE